MGDVKTSFGLSHQLKALGSIYLCLRGMDYVKLKGFYVLSVVGLTGLYISR
jgi:hypothetical protein